MDATVVCGGAHEAAQRVYLLHQVALAYTPNGRVAAHLPQRLDALREEQRARTVTRAREGGFGAGVSAADDNGVETFRMAHGANP